MGETRVMLVEAQGIRCALRLEKVDEVTPPLAVQKISGAPDYALGMAMLRGTACPVLDLSHILSGRNSPSVRYFVGLKTSPRPVILAVDEVLGLRNIDMSSLEALPDFLQSIGSRMVVGVTSVDGKMVAVLDPERRAA